jgi:hypothetical protein
MVFMPCRELAAQGVGKREECLMLPTNSDIRAAKTGEELLIFDVSDDALERAAPIIGGCASVVTLNFGTAIVGNCACPCIEP